MSDDEEWGEIFTYFEGPCTCDHEQEEHTWGSCDVDDCSCEAGWTE